VGEKKATRTKIPRWSAPRGSAKELLALLVRPLDFLLDCPPPAFNSAKLCLAGPSAPPCLTTASKKSSAKRKRRGTMYGQAVKKMLGKHFLLNGFKILM
jgi:hypothetical protein